MFCEVKIRDSKGNLRKIIPPRELSRLHWINFQKAEDTITLTRSGRMAVPVWVRKRLELEYPETSDATCYY